MKLCTGPCHSSCCEGLFPFLFFFFTEHSWWFKSRLKKPQSKVWQPPARSSGILSLRAVSNTFSNISNYNIKAECRTVQLFRMFFQILLFFNFFFIFFHFCAPIITYLYIYQGWSIKASRYSAATWCPFMSACQQRCHINRCCVAVEAQHLHCALWERDDRLLLEAAGPSEGHSVLLWPDAVT